MVNEGNIFHKQSGNEKELLTLLRNEGVTLPQNALCRIYPPAYVLFSLRTPAKNPAPHLTYFRLAGRKPVICIPPTPAFSPADKNTLFILNLAQSLIQNWKTSTQIINKKLSKI